MYIGFITLVGLNIVDVVRYTLWTVEAGGVEVNPITDWLYQQCGMIGIAVLKILLLSIMLPFLPTINNH